MLPSGSASSPFGFETNDPPLSLLEPGGLVGQESICTSIAWATLSTCYSYPLLSALNENQRAALEAYTGAVIDPNDGAFQVQSENIQDLFGSSLNFGSNEYDYGSSNFPAFQYTLPGHVNLGGSSRARYSARLVLYNKTKTIN
jgi:hypothetical protein